MATLNELQRIWIKKFLGIRGGSNSASGPSQFRTFNDISPTVGGTANPFGSASGDAPSNGLIGQQQVLSAGPVEGNPPGAGSGNGKPPGGSGGPPTDLQKYQGRRPPPERAHRQKLQPNADMQHGAADARQAINRPPTDPNSVWDQQKLSADPKLAQTLSDYASGKKGNSVRNLNLSGKTPEQLHDELIKAGFKYEREKLVLFTNDKSQKVYRRRDGNTTTDVTDPEIVPHDIYIHPDGGMVRIKPEGDPGSPVRPEPHASKSVVYDVADGTAFTNEMFKVTATGQPVPKAPTPAAGMKDITSGVPRPLTAAQDSQGTGYADATMGEAHTDLPAYKPESSSSHPPSTAAKDSHPPVGSGTPAKDSKAPAGSATDADKLEKSANELAHKADELNKKYEDLRKEQSKSDPTADQKLQKETEALQTELDAFQKESDSLAKQLETAPELEGVRGASPAETLDNVRTKFGNGVAGGGKVVGAAMKIATAAFVVKSIVEIFEADTALEALSRAADAGKNFAVGAAETAVFEYVMGGSLPAMAVVMVLNMCGDQADACRQQEEQEKQEQLKKQAKEAEKQKLYAIGVFLNKHVPGSVTWLEDHWQPNNKRLWDETVKRVDELHAKHLAEEKAKRLKLPYKLGYQDGLIGMKTYKDRAHTDVPEDAQDAAKAYDSGYKDGDAKKNAAIKRAGDVGLKDGKSGKPSNFDQVKNWDELQQLLSRDFVHHGTPDQVAAGQALYNKYEDAYNEGYAKGQDQFKSVVLKSLEITPQNISMGAYTSRRIFAKGIYTDKSTKDLSGDVIWTPSDKTIVDVGVNDGAAMAFLLSKGRAALKASYSSNGASVASEIKIVVNQPVIAVSPENPSLSVGDKWQFTANGVDKDNDAIPVWGGGLKTVIWKAVPADVISIDQDGNAAMLKAGKAEVTAMDKNSHAVGKATVLIKPKDPSAG